MHDLRPGVRAGLLALAAVLAAGAAAAAGLLTAAPAAGSSACVAVIVDGSRLAGGSVRTGCAQGDPRNGFQALSRAGFTYLLRVRDGLMCEIDGQPDCADTTSSQYWSYWYRDPGSSRWVYANQGAATHNPKPGSTEAWVWQDGGANEPPPRISATTICPQLAGSPTPTSHSPSARPTTTARGGGGGIASSPVPAGSRTPARVLSSKKHRSPQPSSASPATSSTEVPSSAAAGAGPAARPPGRPAADPISGGSGAVTGVAGAAAGGALVLGVGTAAAIRARRQRAP